jgi:transcriptional regulator with XRE-family HTH domain
MHYYRSFREQVEELLKERNWRAYDLAAELQVSTGRISHILAGGDSISLDVIERVADALDVPPTHFDLWVARKLPELAKTAVGLINIGRQLLEAENPRRFNALAAKLVG